MLRQEKDADVWNNEATTNRTNIWRIGRDKRYVKGCTDHCRSRVLRSLQHWMVGWIKIHRNSKKNVNVQHNMLQITRKPIKNENFIWIKPHLKVLLISDTVLNEYYSCVIPLTFIIPIFCDLVGKMVKFISPKHK